MTLKQREQIKKKIISDIYTLIHEIEELQEIVKPITPDCCLGDLTRFEMMADQRVSEKTLLHAQIRLNKLKIAQQSIDKESYGICVDCGDEIFFKRLLILPESTHCIECAS